MLRSSFIALLCVSSVFANCQNGWIRHGNSCYHFSMGKLGWTAAYMMCKIIGGYLVEVNTNDERDFLDETVKQLKGEFWIGGHDSDEENKFVWATSRQPVNVQHNFHPDNTDHNENCLEIWPSGNWNDDVCTDFERYICEAPGDGFGIFG